MKTLLVQRTSPTLLVSNVEKETTLSLVEPRKSAINGFNALTCFLNSENYFSNSLKTNRAYLMKMICPSNNKK